MLDTVGRNTAAWLDSQKSFVNVLSGKIESCIKLAVIGIFFFPFFPVNHHDVITDCTTHWLYNDDNADI